MVELARAAHPAASVRAVPGEELELGETFDYIVLSDLVPYVDDLLALFRPRRRALARATRGS